MAVDLPLSDAELRVLAALLRHRVRFLVVGLSAAALQGAPVVTQDVDLWFEDLGDPRLAKALRQINAAYVPPIALNPPMIAGPGTEPFDVVLRMDGLESFAIECRRAVTVRIGVAVGSDSGQQRSRESSQGSTGHPGFAGCAHRNPAFTTSKVKQRSDIPTQA